MVQIVDLLESLVYMWWLMWWLGVFATIYFRWLMWWLRVFATDFTHLTTNFVSG